MNSLLSLECIQNDYNENKKIIDNYMNKYNKNSNLLDEKKQNYSIELYKLYNEIKFDFDENNVYIIDIYIKEIGTEGILCLKIIESLDSKILDKIADASRYLKCLGSIFGVIGFAYDIYKLFNETKDPIEEKLDQLLETIKNSTEAINMTVKEEGLKNRMALIKDNVYEKLSEIDIYTKGEFNNRINEYSPSTSLERLKKANIDIQSILSKFNFDNKNAFLHRYLKNIYDTNIRNTEIFKELLDLDIFYKDSISYCNDILQNVTDIIINYQYFTDIEYKDLMVDVYANIKILIKCKNNDLRQLELFMKISNECIQTFYDDYRSKRLKVGDNIFIQSPANNYYLSAQSRDFLFFCTNNKRDWEGFRIEDVYDGNKMINNGELIRYGYTLRLRSHKSYTDERMGVYEYFGLHERNILTVATHHWDMWNLKKMNYMKIIHPDKVCNDYIFFDSRARISIAFDNFTKDLGCVLSTGRASLFDNWVVNICK